MNGPRIKSRRLCLELRPQSAGRRRWVRKRWVPEAIFETSICRWRGRTNSGTTPAAEHSERVKRCSLEDAEQAQYQVDDHNGDDQAHNTGRPTQHNCLLPNLMRCTAFCG
jgi:hypothetical protein